MNNAEVSDVVFLNLKKAFDLVDHDILLKKLTTYLKIACSLPLLNHIFITECCLSYSSEDSVRFGVPQGSVLGPVLSSSSLLIIFLIFINDLPLHVNNISVDCDILQS